MHKGDRHDAKTRAKLRATMKAHVKTEAFRKRLRAVMARRPKSAPHYRSSRGLS